MRKYISLFSIIFSFIFISAFIGCGESSDDNEAGLTSFYDKMQDTTPVYSTIDGSRSSKVLNPTGTWGDNSNKNTILYSTFFTLREYTFPDDEGIVDRSNFYKLLFDVDSVFEGAYANAVALPEAKEIDSPFAGISTAGVLFTNAANIQDDELSVAYTEENDILTALVTWKWTEDGSPLKAERGIAYYTYDKNTDDITVDMVFSVDYDITDAATEYNLRCTASGNVADHSFQFNYRIGNNQIIAKGISQGDGNYVIFKFKNDAEEGPFYLRVDVGEGEQFFKDIFDSGYATGVEATNYTGADAEGYITWIDDQTFLAATDLLTTTANLNIEGGAGLAGTINLDF